MFRSLQIKEKGRQCTHPEATTVHPFISSFCFLNTNSITFPLSSQVAHVTFLPSSAKEIRFCFHRHTNIILVLGQLQLSNSYLLPLKPIVSAQCVLSSNCSYQAV